MQLKDKLWKLTGRKKKTRKDTGSSVACHIFDCTAQLQHSFSVVQRGFSGENNLKNYNNNTSNQRTDSDTSCWHYFLQSIHCSCIFLPVYWIPQICNNLFSHSIWIPHKFRIKNSTNTISSRSNSKSLLPAVFSCLCNIFAFAMTNNFHYQTANHEWCCTSELHHIHIMTCLVSLARHPSAWLSLSCISYLVLYSVTDWKFRVSYCSLPF